MIDWCAIWDFVVEYGGKLLNILGGLSGLLLLVVGGAQLCGKKWLDWWFEKKNKDYQAKLDEHLTMYKADIEAKNKEIQSLLDTKIALLKIEYSTLYTKRTDIINIIHKRLVKIRSQIIGIEKISQLNIEQNMAVNDLDEKTRNEFNNLYKAYMKLIDNLDKFTSYVNNNQLYLSAGLVKNICTLESIILKYTHKYPFAILERIDKEMSEGVKLNDNKLDILLDTLSADQILKVIDSVMGELRSEFRHLIGADIKRN